MLYPGYSGNPISIDNQITSTANSISRSPLVRVKFANLVSASDSNDVEDGGLLGWIDGVAITPQVEQGFIIEEKNHYPKLYKISIKLNVLHEHDLGFGEENTWLGTNKKWPFGGFNNE